MNTIRLLVAFLLIELVVGFVPRKGGYGEYKLGNYGYNVL